MGKFNDEWKLYNDKTRGYLFEEKETGIIHRPHFLFCKFYEDDKQSIEMLKELSHPEFTLENVIGWTNGIITEPDLVFEKSV